MTATLVPFAVLVVASFLVWTRATGRDLEIPVFLLPWTALTPDVGVQLPLAKLLFALIAIKYIQLGRFRPLGVPHLGPVILLVALSFLAATVTFGYLSPENEVAGGALRNGWPRVLVVTTNFVLTVLIFALVFSPGLRVSAERLFRVYVASIVILCLLALLQLAVFRMTGSDPFPLGLFQFGAEGATSAVTVLPGGITTLRPGSLAGEPKTLAMFAASAAIVVAGLGRHLGIGAGRRVFALTLFVTTILVTQSTSALLALPVAMLVYGAVRLVGRPLSRAELSFAYVVAASALLAVFVQQVAFGPVPGNEWLELSLKAQSIWDLVYHRTVGRLTVEDFDWVILKTFIADPAQFVLGKGLGLGHLGGEKHIPLAWEHYMQGRVLSPKSGVLYFTVMGGVVGLALAMVWFAALTPSLSKRSAQSRPDLARLALCLQLVLVPTIFVLLMRTYILDAAILVSALSALMWRRALLGQGRAVAFGQGFGRIPAGAGGRAA